MDPRFSLKVYPRKDTVYKTRSSLDFTTIHSNVYENRKKNKFEEGSRWLLHMLIGFSVGVIAFYMTIFEESVFNYKKEGVQTLLTDGKDVWTGWGY